MGINGLWIIYAYRTIAFFVTEKECSETTGLTFHEKLSSRLLRAPLVVCEAVVTPLVIRLSILKINKIFGAFMDSTYCRVGYKNHAARNSGRENWKPRKYSPNNEYILYIILTVILNDFFGKTYWKESHMHEPTTKRPTLISRSPLLWTTNLLPVTCSRLYPFFQTIFGFGAPRTRQLKMAFFPTTTLRSRGVDVNVGEAAEMVHSMKMNKQMTWIIC